MTIVTKTGDDGSTGLWGGERVNKDSDLIEAIGDVDELNSILGLIRSELDDQEIDQVLEYIQNRCFTIGAEISSIKTENKIRDQKIPHINNSDIELIEKKIEKMEKNLPELKNFILPTGSKTASLFFFGRSICRRAERSVVRLKEKNLDLNQKFLNRLSDLLFLLARQSNQDKEIIWQGKSKND